MRIACLDCARKHVSQAEHLLHEWRAAPQKYRIHKWYAIGHLAEAEVELMARWPEQAYLIRQHRLLLIAEPTYKVPTHKIIEDLCDAEEAMQSNGLSEDGSPSEDVLQQTLADAGSGSTGESDGGVSKQQDNDSLE